MTECRYKGWCRIEYDTDFDVCYPCIGDGADTCIEYEPMPDVKALLEMADEMDERKTWSCTAERIWSRSIARRIREAIGEKQ